MYVSTTSFKLRRHKGFFSPCMPVQNDNFKFMQQYGFKLYMLDCYVCCVIFILYLGMGWNYKLPALATMAGLIAFDLKCFLDEDSLNGLLGEYLNYY